MDGDHAGLGRRAARAVGVLSYAWLATGFRPFSSGALLATVCAGLVVIGVGTRRRLPPPTPRRGVGASVWGLLAGTLAVWELASGRGAAAAA